MPATPTIAQPAPLLRVADVIELSGVSESTVHREIKCGNLRSFRFGRMLRIDRSDYEAWVASKRAPQPQGSTRAA